MVLRGSEATADESGPRGAGAHLALRAARSRAQIHRVKNAIVPV